MVIYCGGASTHPLHACMRHTQYTLYTICMFTLRQKQKPARCEKWWANFQFIILNTHCTVQCTLWRFVCYSVFTQSRIKNTVMTSKIFNIAGICSREINFLKLIPWIFDYEICPCPFVNVLDQHEKWVGATTFVVLEIAPPQKIQFFKIFDIFEFVLGSFKNPLRLKVKEWF